MTTSASSLDAAENTYLSLIGRLFAAVVATLLGSSLILAGALGFGRDAEAKLLAMSAGVALLLLALEQAWRVTRRLG